MWDDAFVKSHSRVKIRLSFPVHAIYSGTDSILLLDLVNKTRSAFFLFLVGKLAVVKELEPWRGRSGCGIQDDR